MIGIHRLLITVGLALAACGAETALGGGGQQVTGEPRQEPRTEVAMGGASSGASETVSSAVTGGSVAVTDAGPAVLLPEVVEPGGGHPRDAEPSIVCGPSSSEVVGPDGGDYGYSYCGDLLHRREQQDCSPPHPGSCDESLIPEAGPSDDACRTNEDCTRGIGGLCHGCRCWYGCIRDADCGPGSACMCISATNACVRAECVTDADCPDSFCGLYSVCGVHVLACRDPGDPCYPDGGLRR